MIARRDLTTVGGSRSSSRDRGRRRDAISSSVAQRDRLRGARSPVSTPERRRRRSDDAAHDRSTGAHDGRRIAEFGPTHGVRNPAGDATRDRRHVGRRRRPSTRRRSDDAAHDRSTGAHDGRRIAEFVARSRVRHAAVTPLPRASSCSVRADRHAGERSRRWALQHHGSKGRCRADHLGPQLDGRGAVILPRGSRSYPAGAARLTGRAQIGTRTEPD